MSAKVTIWAWKIAKTAFSAKEGPLLLTFLALADMARDHGKVWASHGFLAEKARQSPRTVRGNIEELERRGLLRTESVKGRPDVVWLNLTAVTLFEAHESDEPGALEKGPRRPRHEMPTSESGTSASGAGGVGAACIQTSAPPAYKPRSEPNLRTQGEANASAGERRPTETVLAFDAYNQFASLHELPKAERLNDDRRRRLGARLKDCGGIDGWLAALERVSHSPFLMGQTHHHFRLTLDFLIQPSSFTKLIEGAYEDRTDGGSPASVTRPDRAAERQRSVIDPMLAGAMEVVKRRRRWGL